MEEDQHLYQVAMSRLPGIGPQLTRQLISYCGSAKGVFSAPAGQLVKIPGIGQATASTIREKSSSALSEAEALLRQAERQGVQLLFYTSDRFPNRLKQHPDAPTLLYYSGTADLNHKRIVSIVGTRQATAYGQAVTERMIEDLKPHNVMVISGLAYGIDIIAHRAALQAGLPTIGVMASGPDIIYPAVHRKYAERMLSQGGLLTESTFGTKPDAPRFPARNRIIAGMSDCTIVVEAAYKSGTLITADIAHSYDKEVMAVPGNINAPGSEGPNFLIKSLKAAAYTSSKDLIELMNWDLDKSNGKPANIKAMQWNPADYSPDEWKVLEVLLQTEAEQMDNLSWKTQIPVSLLASVLLSLEFKGVVKAIPGKKFKLLG